MISMKISRKRKRQVLGMITGVFIGTLLYTIILIPGNDHMSSLGPMNTGHEDLKCQDCHSPAKGTLAQQLTTNFMHLVGMRKSSTTFGLENVDTKKCQSCHERPNDRHPVHRFEEPRFSKARKNIEATQCESCHLEHNGVRLTLTEINYCQNCHQETALKDDPLEISHAALIEGAQWNTCLQCHDFHGNHQMKVAHTMKDTIEVKAILQYFQGGKDPYSDKKKYIAEKEKKELYQ